MTESKEAPEEEITILDYLLPILKWRWLIFWVSVAAALTGAGVSLIQKPAYTATAYFVPRGAWGESDELTQLLGARGKNWETIRSATEIVSYFSVVLMTGPLVEKMLNRKFNSAEHGEATLLEILHPQGRDEAERLRRGILKFQEAVKIASGNGKVVTVSYTSPEPQLAADVVNALLEEYMRLPQEVDRAAATKLFIKTNLDEVQRTLNAKEDEIAKAKGMRMDTNPQAAIRLAALEREAKMLEERLISLSSEYAKAEIRVLQSQEQNMKDIDVIDPARPPLLKSNASRKKIVLIFIILSALATMGLAVVADGVKALYRSTGHHDFWSLLKRARRDLLIMGCVALAAVISLAVYSLGLFGRGS